MESIEDRFASRAELKEGLDKLGEEIAYDINQIESQISTQQSVVEQLKVSFEG